MEAAAHSKLLALYRFMRTLPGAEHLEITFAAEECGIRETKRIKGEATVTREDYLSGRLYDDAVCYAFYPIDLHVMEGVRKTHLDKGVVPTIPYGALIPKNAERVLAAGRCISADTDANSAIRVQAPCMATGQAAGCAAAIAALKGVPVAAVPYEDLCRALTAQGAIVPQRRFLNRT